MGSPWQPWTQNLYAYVGNNPVNLIDPTGHSPHGPLLDGGGEPQGKSCDEYAQTNGQAYLDVCSRGRFTAIVVDAYIPSGPFSYQGNEYSGDERGPAFNEGTNRGRQIVLTDPTTHETYVHASGDPTHNYTQGEVGCACGKGLTANVWNTDYGDVIIGLDANSKDPVAYVGSFRVPQVLVPGFRYDLTIRVTEAGGISVDGVHGVFPAYEIWVRKPGADPQLIHSYTPDPLLDPASLFRYPWLGGVPVTATVP